MTLPDADQLYSVIDETWPPARVIDLPGWKVREGVGGGQRVSSATATTSAPDIAAMEAAHHHLGQVPLVMIREGDTALDVRLDSAGYQIKDPVTVYLADVASLADTPPPVTAFLVAWPPVEVQTEIWAQGGIGDGRVAVMERADGPKCTILGRTNNQPAGTAFVAIHENIAMLHALEVSPKLRRNGTSRHIMQAAAIWAQNAGAEWISVVVTTANTAANALYASLGMVPVGEYHYRILAAQHEARPEG